MKFFPPTCGKAIQSLHCAACSAKEISCVRSSTLTLTLNVGPHDSVIWTTTIGAWCDLRVRGLEGGGGRAWIP